MGRGVIRTCSGCRARRPQADMIRVARRSDGTVSVDPASDAGAAPPRHPGRGAYVCPTVSCIERAVGGGLQRALRHRSPLPEHVRVELLGRIEAGRR